MIIKLKEVVSVSSEHSLYPASNLLVHPPQASWRCAKPKELMATVVLKLAEPSCITGIDIGNYHCCIIIVEACTAEEPDKWVPVVNHQFMSHDDAVNNRFRDQVQLFTKKELNKEILKIKFDKIKVICMQSANLREIFGLTFIVLRSEVEVDLDLDVFGRFKLKNDEENGNDFKEKYLKLFGNKEKNYKEKLKETVTQKGVENFKKLQDKEREHKKKPELEKMEASAEAEATSASSSKDSPKVNRTLFGDVIPDKTPNKKRNINSPTATSSSSSTTKKIRCSVCKDNSENGPCPSCNLLSPPKASNNSPRNVPPKKTKPKKEFSKLFEDVSFALSGYQNPKRDQIRSKALKMGGKYIPNPDTVNNKCTHLICAFKNTPKSQQLKGHCKIVTHKFIEDCFEQKKRIPWRRFSLSGREKNQPDSEEEIEGTTTPVAEPSSYDQDTDVSEPDY